MKKLFIILLLLWAGVAYGASTTLSGTGSTGLSGTGSTGFVASGGETIGNTSQESTQLDTPSNNLYIIPVSGQFTNSGTLDYYTATMREQTGSRTIRLGLYTFDGTDEFTLVANSDTGTITYVASADKTNVTFTLSGSVSVLASTDYYLAFQTGGYGAIYVNTSAGTYYDSYLSEGNAMPSSFTSTSTHTGTPGVWSLTQN